MKDKPLSKRIAVWGICLMVLVPAVLYINQMRKKPTAGDPVTPEKERIFDDVTADAGLPPDTEPAYGISWGDFNSDGYPDLWIGHHGYHPALYLNNRDGTFADIIDGIWSADPEADTHAAAWADFDNDGDQDLIELTGAYHGQSSQPNHLFVNEGGQLIERASEWGVDAPPARGRTPLWFDCDRDGSLELVVSNSKRKGFPSTIYKRTQNGFTNIHDLVGFECLYEDNFFVQTADLTGDGIMDLVFHAMPKINPETRNTRSCIQVFDTSTMPFKDLTADLGLYNSGSVRKVGFIRDMAMADFNGDLHTDIFLASGHLKIPEVYQPGEKKLLLFLRNKESVQFRTDADAEIKIRFFLKRKKGKNTIFLDQKALEKVKILTPDMVVKKLDLTSQDTGYPAKNRVVMRYSGETNNWVIEAGSFVGMTIMSSSPIYDVVETSSFSDDEKNEDENIYKDQLLIYAKGGFKDISEESGLHLPTRAKFCAAGDFDNDMDVDIYMTCSQEFTNLPNIYYENLGNGRFRSVPDAAGASGPVKGKSGAVAVADYDRDGFLDLFMANNDKHGSIVFRINFDAHQLFRNRGNENHWIEIELEGRASNRDGIGARAIAETPDGRKQLREQNNGIHLRCQNDQTLHFGLGENTAVKQLTVFWPSGKVQKLADLKADQFIKVTEP